MTDALKEIAEKHIRDAFDLDWDASLTPRQHMLRTLLKALPDAHALGRREGLEEAAKECEQDGSYGLCYAAAIRALLEESQK